MIASPQAPRPSASARAASAEVGRQEPIKKCWNGLQPDYHVADQWNLVNLCFHVRPGKICTWKQNTWVEFEIHKTYKRKSSITCRFETKHLQHLSKNTIIPQAESPFPVTLHRSLENLPSERAMFGPPWLMHLRLDRQMISVIQKDLLFCILDIVFIFSLNIQIIRI